MKKTISILIPTFNEEENIKSLSEDIELNTKNLNYEFEYLIIDNCSSDNTQSIIREICKKNKKFKAIFNTKNFGPDRSSYYGMLQTKGDAVIFLSSDYQDPPELIPKLVKKWEAGSNVVLLKRKSSKEGLLRETFNLMFYKFLKLISDVNLQVKTSGYGLYSKKVINDLKKINDPYPYLRGLVSEVEKNIDVLEYDKKERSGGKSSSSVKYLADLALIAIAKHSRIPLRFVTLFGFFVSAMSLLVGFFFFGYKLLYWESFQLGIAPVIIGLFAGISFLIFMLGIIGEYIGNIFIQVRNLPLIFEKERVNFDDENND
jgi:glycosyltransferase involved in cell wall biosynthesis